MNRKRNDLSYTFHLPKVLGNIMRRLRPSHPPTVYVTLVDFESTSLESYLCMDKDVEEKF